MGQVLKNRNENKRVKLMVNNANVEMKVLKVLNYSNKKQAIYTI